MKPGKLLIAAVIVAGLGACAEKKIAWVKPDMGQFTQDDYACTRDAYETGGFSTFYGTTQRIPNRNIYIQCMQAHGYSRAEPAEK